MSDQEVAEHLTDDALVAELKRRGFLVYPRHRVRILKASVATRTKWKDREEFARQQVTSMLGNQIMRQGHVVLTEVKINDDITLVTGSMAAVVPTEVPPWPTPASG